MADNNKLYFGPSLGPDNKRKYSIPIFEESLRTYFGFTQKQLRTIVIFGLANLFSWTIYALQAPFYPKEAEDKGASPSEYGLVLGIFQLVMFIMSPVFGYIVGFVNPRLVFNLGIFVTATCALLFGFLHFIEDHLTFIALSFLLRILQGCGDAAFVTASFTIIAVEFPDSVASTFATLETCSGVGLIIGPSLGGVLFQLGGFVLPFFFMGSCFLAVGILTYFLLPPNEEEPVKKKNAKDEESNIDIVEKSGVLGMLSIPTVFLGFFSLFVCSSSIGFTMATLEPHLREHFVLSPAVTGLIFLIDGGVYAISAPFWGKLCDESDQLHIYTIIGSAMAVVGYLLIGPAPFISIPTILWLTCVGLAIYGVGTGATYVSSFILAMKGSVANGFPESLATYGLVSGLYTSSFSSGSFVGSSIGGVLLDFYGFKSSSYYVLATQMLVIIIACIYLCMPNTINSKLVRETETEMSSEKDRLLDSNISEDDL